MVSNRDATPDRTHVADRAGAATFWKGHGSTRNESPPVPIFRNEIKRLHRFGDEVIVECGFTTYRHHPLKDGTARHEEVRGG